MDKKGIPETDICSVKSIMKMENKIKQKRPTTSKETDEEEERYVHISCWVLLANHYMMEQIKLYLKHLRYQ